VLCASGFGSGKGAYLHDHCLLETHGLFLGVGKVFSEAKISFTEPIKRCVIDNRSDICPRSTNANQYVLVQQLQDKKPYTLRGIFGDSILLPPSTLPWLQSQPESHLSTKWAQMDALNIPETFLRPEIGLNPVYEPLVRREPTAHLERIAGPICEEVELSLKEFWGMDTGEWKEVNLDFILRRVVASATNRIWWERRFVGHAAMH
jgi:hypothetical protein